MSTLRRSIGNKANKSNEPSTNKGRNPGESSAPSIDPNPPINPPDLKQQKESGSYNIWKHAFEKISTNSIAPTASSVLLSGTLTDDQNTFQHEWLRKLWRMASKAKPEPEESVEVQESDFDIARSTRRLAVRISYFMETLINQFKSINPYNPLNVGITLPQEVKEPQYFEPLEYGKERKIVESYFRFRVSTSSWSISVRANAGAVEFFMLPNTDLIRLSLHERSERLKLRLVLDKHETKEYFDLWSLDGLPVDDMELSTILRDLFKELILRSCGQTTLDAGLLLPDLQGERLMKALHDLILEKQGLAQKIVMQQEEIQNRLARDLHDTVISDVMMLKRSLSGDRRLSDQEAIDVLDKITSHLRDVCYDLAPRDLKDWGLGTVIEDLLQNIARRSGADFTYDCESEIPELPGEVQLHIFRIFQEALNNIEKYADAKNIAVSIKREGPKLKFVIADDGKGFEVTGHEQKFSKEGGFGLGGIRERADLIRCYYPTELFVESEPHKGSQVRLDVTFSKKAGEDEYI
jgi:signal transduction histidine kinase